MLQKSLAIALAERYDETKSASHVLRELFDLNPLPMWISDITGKCDYANAALLSLFGITLEEATQKGWEQFLAAREKADKTEFIQKLSIPEDGAKFEVAEIYRTKSGHDFPVLCQMKIVKSSVVGVLVPRCHLISLFSGLFKDGIIGHFDCLIPSSKEDEPSIAK